MLLPSEISAVILAGGQGRRVGYQQKALLPYKNQPVIKTVLDKLIPQVNDIWISVNGDLSAYVPYTEKLFTDNYSGFLGPLAGMHAAWQHVTHEWVLFVPCDNPNLPSNFVEQMLKVHSQSPAPLVVANDGSRMQPLYLLMHRTMSSSLEKAIEKNHLSVHRWVKENEFIEADFSKANANIFENMNTLQYYDN